MVVQLRLSNFWRELVADSIMQFEYTSPINRIFTISNPIANLCFPFPLVSSQHIHWGVKWNDENKFKKLLLDTEDGCRCCFDVSCRWYFYWCLYSLLNKTVGLQFLLETVSLVIFWITKKVADYKFIKKVTDYITITIIGFKLCFLKTRIKFSAYQPDISRRVKICAKDIKKNCHRVAVASIRRISHRNAASPGVT